jgi:hypothetical protein
MSGILEPRTEKMDDGRIRLYASATSTESTNMWVAVISFGIGLGLWLWLAQSTLAWIIGTVVAVVYGGGVLREIWKWIRARPLRKSLGEIVLSVNIHPARVGEPLEIRIAQRLRSNVRVQATSIRLRRDERRISTGGIHMTETKFWVNTFDIEFVALRDVNFERDDVLSAEIETEIPADQYESNDRNRWWVVVETAIDGCPPYSASFPLKVVRTDNDDSGGSR